MFHMRQTWERLTRLEVVMSLSIALISGAATLWTALSEKAPDLTSVGWLAVFFAIALTVVLLIGAAGWARQLWITPAMTNGPAPASVLGSTRALIRFFGDERNPEHIQVDNIYRWFVLRNKMVSIMMDGTRNEVETTNIFIVFECPVSYGQIMVRSKDFRIDYEVKDKSDRHVIIACGGVVPSGELEIFAK